MPRRNPDKPPVFRGSDFAARWEQSRWSEERIREAIDATGEFVAIPYGRSSVGPDDRGKIKEYWHRFVEVEGDWKRPDFLLVSARTYKENEGKWKAVLAQDTTIQSDETLAPILQSAICGIEAENSLWIAEHMPDFDSTLPLRRLSIVSPTIWVKEEDCEPLQQWSKHFNISIVVVQVFCDRGYMIELDAVLDSVANILAAPETERRALQKQVGVIFNRPIRMHAQGWQR